MTTLLTALFAFPGGAVRLDQHDFFTLEEADPGRDGWLPTPRRLVGRRDPTHRRTVIAGDPLVERALVQLASLPAFFRVEDTFYNLARLAAVQFGPHVLFHFASGNEAVVVNPDAGAEFRRRWDAFVDTGPCSITS